MDLFSSFERRGEPLAPHWLFARRLVINVGLGLALIGVSLLAGMVGYHYLEGAGWVDAFDQAAMIIGGMGPYSEPKSDGGKLFAGFYALYSGMGCRHRREDTAIRASAEVYNLRRENRRPIGVVSQRLRR